MTPTPPQQDPSSRYSSRFPSSWLLSAQNGANRMISSGHRQATTAEILRTPAPATPLSPLTPLFTTSIPTSAFTFRPELLIRMPIHASAEHETTQIQAPFFDEADTPYELTRTEQMLSELKGEPTHHNNEEEIGIWVQSLDPTVRARAFGNAKSSIDNRLCVVGDKHPSSFDDDFSDVSGLGDAPHVTHEVYDTYSIYSTSTYR